MVIYESGWTEQDVISSLMEMAATQRYSLRILNDLAPTDQRLVARYQSKIEAYYAAKQMRGFIKEDVSTLHLSITKSFNGAQLLRGNLQHDLAQVQPKLVLPYEDTNCVGDRFLVAELSATPELKFIQEQVATLLRRYGITTEIEQPHLTLGRNPPDTPDESVTTDPGFRSLGFNRLTVTALPV